MYHRVGIHDHIFTKHLQVSPESLEMALRYFISKDIDIVSLDECYSRISAGVRGKRFVLFTLDYGYVRT